MNHFRRSIRILPLSKNSLLVRNFIMSSSLLKEAVETLQKNPFYDKYAEKIVNKQKVAPGEFEELWKKLKKNQEKEQMKSVSADAQKPFGPGQPKPSVSTPPQNTKGLDTIMKIDLIKDKSSEEIEKAWIEYHKTKPFAIAASVPKDVFENIKQKFQKFPVFLLPLPRDQGYEFIMLQFAANEIHFTPLISYQTHKENAPDCLAITYYTELLEDKEIVLLRGEFDKNIINAMEAQCLANQVQLFYGENNENRNKLLETFTFYPHQFKHMDLVAEINTLSL